MRVAISVLVIASLFIGAAGAETLAPGRPAGIRAAQKHGPNIYLVGTVGALAVAGAAVLISESHSALATTFIPGGQQTATPVTTSVAATTTTG